jgi:hypothetical protein
VKRIEAEKIKTWMIGMIRMEAIRKDVEKMRGWEGGKRWKIRRFEG